MADITFSAVIVGNSITNSSVSSDRALDNTSPFTFFEFLKQTSATYTPEEYTIFYNQYIINWSAVKNVNAPISDFIAEQYIELFKDISLNYTTFAEKRFLTSFDYTDTSSLDIIIPFYTRKLREIVLFYKQKRDTGTFVIERNKIKGTQYSIQKAVYELITQFAFSDVSSELTINYNLENIKRNLNIDIHEFVDVYSNYFDIDRDSSDETSLRLAEFTYNTNDIDKSNFFSVNDEINKAIFGSQVLLIEIPIAINARLNLNPTCSDTNPLQEIIERDQNDLLGASDRMLLRRRLYQKYLGTDFCYLSTNTLSDFISGTFIQADNPSNNLLNRQTADIAAVQSDQITKLRDIGLFFKPDKQGVLNFNAKSYKWEVDTANLQPDTVYIFPQPNSYGNVSINAQEEYPLIYKFDATPEIKNSTHGIAAGDPRFDRIDQQFLPYFSRRQTKGIDDTNEFINLSDLYNEGLITKWQTDVFGNEYAMFKDKFGQYFIDSIPTPASNLVTCLTLDGHLFYDPDEGYNFNYSTVEQVNETTYRSGVSARMVCDESSPSFILSSCEPAYNLNYRQFTPYQFCDDFSSGGETNDKIVTVYDCGGLTKNDGSRLPDPLTADDNDFPANAGYYYDVLVDAGLGQISPPSSETYRAFLFTNSTFLAEADLRLDLKYATDSNYPYLDGGLLTDNLISGTETSNNNIFIDQVSDGYNSVLLSLTANNTYSNICAYAHLTGKSYVRAAGSAASVPLSAALAPVIEKYSTAVQSDIRKNLVDFDIVYDTIIFETESRLVFDKIKYTADGYTKPATKNTVYQQNTASPYSIFTNRWFNEKDNTIVFCLMEEYPVLSGSNYNSVYPNIYKYNITTNNTTKLWPKHTADVIPLLSSFAVKYPSTSTPSLSFGIVCIDTPKITHNDLNDMYKLTYIGKDLNNFPHIFDIGFRDTSSGVVFTDSKLYTQLEPTTILQTTQFATTSASYIQYGTVLNMTTTSVGIL